MAVFAIRMPDALARYFIKIGGNDLSKGVRKIGEEHKNGFVERRSGPADRRKK